MELNTLIYAAVRVHPSPYHGYVGWNILTDGVIIADLIDTKKDRFSVVKVYLNRVDLKMDVSRRKLEQMVRDTGVLITYCVTTYAYADRGCIFLVNENYPFNYHLSGARDSGFFPDKRRNLFTTARALADPCDFYGLRKILNAWYLEASQNPGQSTFMSDVCYKMSCHSFSCWASPRYKCPKCNVTNTKFYIMCHHIEEVHGLEFSKSLNFKKLEQISMFW